MMRRITILFKTGRLEMIRTTININKNLLSRLKKAMYDIDLPKDEVIKLLLSRILRKKDFHPRPDIRVKYQGRRLKKDWKKEHITLDPVFYEKFLDLRRNYKFSVSWFIAFAIRNYLDELVAELTNPRDPEKILDNYDWNSVYITRMLGNIPLFISVLGFPELKYLEKLLNIAE
jgi:hypothetical protein